MDCFVTFLGSRMNINIWCTILTDKYDCPSASDTQLYGPLWTKWRPWCDIDGSYKAVQCKTNGPDHRYLQIILLLNLIELLRYNISHYDWFIVASATTKKEIAYSALTGILPIPGKICTAVLFLNSFYFKRKFKHLFTDFNLFSRSLCDFLFHLICSVFPISRGPEKGECR